MMNESKNISFYPFGNFLIARVAVSGAYLRGDKPYKEKVYIACQQGYELYYSTDGKHLNIYDQNETCAKNNQLKNVDELYIYCLKTGEYEISIPYGVAKAESGQGYNFIITAKCNSAEKAVEKILGGFFMRNAWNHIEKDGLIYDYVNEFFINNDHRPGGLSIAFRDEFAEIFKSFLSENDRDDSIKKAIQKFNAKYNGFVFSSTSVEVN